MTGSTSEGDGPASDRAVHEACDPGLWLSLPVPVRLAIIGLFGAGMIAAPSWCGRLTPGIVVFAIAGVTMHIVRTLATGDAPLAVRGESDPLRQQILVKAVGAGGLIVPLIYMLTPWLDFASYTLPRGAVILGAVLYSGGMWIFWRSHADLGRFWSPVLEMRHDHQLVTDGIYRRIRHPMYAAIFLFFIGQALCLGNWIAGLSGLGAFTLLYLVRIGPEERMLADTFGEAWQIHAARTGRIWPRR